MGGESQATFGSMRHHNHVDKKTTPTTSYDFVTCIYLWVFGALTKSEVLLTKGLGCEEKRRFGKLWEDDFIKESTLEELGL